MWLEVSAEGKVNGKSWLVPLWGWQDNALLKATGGLLLTVSWPHQELPTCLWPLSPPPAGQPSSLTSILPAQQRREQPCSKAEDKAQLSASAVSGSGQLTDKELFELKALARETSSAGINHAQACGYSSWARGAVPRGWCVTQRVSLSQPL